jgi:hypothetical protein
MEEEKIYRGLGKKINSLTVKAPWNKTLSTLDRSAKTTGLEKTHVRTVLARLCHN